MLQPALSQYRFLASFGEGLLAGFDHARAFEPACPGGNHPAWILGHLVYAGLGAVKLIGGDETGQEAYEERFGMGSAVEPAGRDDFAELLDAWRETHRRVEAAAADAPAGALAAENPVERFRAAFPTAGDMATFLLTGHEAVHLGQLSAWRRAAGAVPMF